MTIMILKASLYWEKMNKSSDKTALQHWLNKITSILYASENHETRTKNLLTINLKKSNILSASLSSINVIFSLQRTSCHASKNQLTHMIHWMFMISENNIAQESRISRWLIQKFSSHSSWSIKDLFNSHFWCRICAARETEMIQDRNMSNMMLKSVFTLQCLCSSQRTERT